MIAFILRFFICILCLCGGVSFYAGIEMLLDKLIFKKKIGITAADISFEFGLTLFFLTISFLFYYMYFIL